MQTTKGIVLKSTPYSETSLIVQILTKDFGMQSYIVNGVKKSKSKFAPAIFTSLNLVEVTAKHNTASTALNRISEIRSTPCLTQIPFDITKMSIAMFLTEVIYKSCKHQDKDDNLFNFIFNAVQVLDITPYSVSNFHIVFLLKLTSLLGFYPNMQNQTSLFDMKEGVMQFNMPLHNYILTDNSLINFKKALDLNFENQHNCKFSYQDRITLLNDILCYYNLHISNFGEVKSLAVFLEMNS